MKTVSAIVIQTSAGLGNLALSDGKAIADLDLSGDKELTSPALAGSSMHPAGVACNLRDARGPKGFAGTARGLRHVANTVESCDVQKIPRMTEGMCIFAGARR
jgi:hypothetical protein